MSSIELMTTKEVAELLRRSRRTIYRLCDSGKMPKPSRIGGTLVWKRQVIEDWINGGCKPLPQESPERLRLTRR